MLCSMFDQVAGGAFRHTTGTTSWHDGQKYLSTNGVIYVFAEELSQIKTRYERLKEHFSG